MQARIIGISIVLSLGILVGCGEDYPPTAEIDHLEIHLWQVFVEDAVEVELDNVEIFSGVVTTNQIFTLAERIPTSAVHGNHKLTVKVNDRWIGSVRFNLNEPLFIGVSFFRDLTERQFDFEFLEEEPVYY